MLKIILNAPHIIKPFNERARDLRIQNQPLWLYQRNVLAPYVTLEAGTGCVHTAPGHGADDAKVGGVRHIRGTRGSSQDETPA